jgi:hypothetical protein
MKRSARNIARSTSHRSRFLSYLAISLFAGFGLLTISAYFGYPFSFTGGSTSCLFVASEYQCTVSSPMLIAWDYIFWCTATLAIMSILDAASARLSSG